MKSNRVRGVVIAAVVPAFQIVMRRAILRFGLFPLGLQLLLGAIAAIRDAARQELARDLVIQRVALRLAKGTFIPLQAQPSEIVKDHLLRLARRARDIGVLDAKNERAFVMLREQPVEDRGARAADVKMARR